MEFKLHSNYKPTGDQPQAIEYLSNGIINNKKCQTLLGVTGSGKTFTMANIIQKVQKPTLILAHNKTLAGQLYNEFKEFFPENAVEYFVSYYDYYQPEAYIANTDTYIEKDSAINDEIDKLRHSATAALFERDDVIIVSSVSCIYGLGDPDDYSNLTLSLRPGMIKDRDELLKKLIEIQYERNDIEIVRSKFRVKGDVVEVFPAGFDEKAIRIEFFGDEIEKISEFDPLTGKALTMLSHTLIHPASHYVTSGEKMKRAITAIEDELAERIEYFNSQNKLLEAQRIEQRTNFDLEMLQEIGFCQGIENYSRHISGRKPGEAPYTLIDYFPNDFLLIVDESHVTLPQVRGMYNGDRARKDTLVEYGFRLPSAYDNRPLTFTEFEDKINQLLCVSATPAEYELEHSDGNIAEQIIRPTGLLDPEIEVRPIDNQIDDLIGEINKVTAKNQRVLVTTLTKKMAEDLTDYLQDVNIKVKYLHSDIDTLERMDTINELRQGVFDVLVGINLLREGLDIPEVSLVAILDADKTGFLRSERSLIQTIGRAARNSEGHVIMYADALSEAMEKAIKETNRRRTIQHEYNVKNGIIPKTIIKQIHENIQVTKKIKDEDKKVKLNPKDKEKYMKELEKRMKAYAADLDFENAALIRDELIKLQGKTH